MANDSCVYRTIWGRRKVGYPCAVIKPGRCAIGGNGDYELVYGPANTGQCNEWLEDNPERWALFRKIKDFVLGRK